MLLGCHVEVGAVPTELQGPAVAGEGFHVTHGGGESGVSLLMGLLLRSYLAFSPKSGPLASGIFGKPPLS